MRITTKEKEPETELQDGVPTLELIDLIRLHADRNCWCDELEGFLERTLGLHFRERDQSNARLRFNRRYKIPDTISRERLDFVLRAARMIHTGYEVRMLITDIRNQFGVSHASRTYHVTVETDLDMGALLAAAYETGNIDVFNVDEARLRQIAARAVRDRLQTVAYRTGPFDGTITLSEPDGTLTQRPD